MLPLCLAPLPTNPIWRSETSTYTGQDASTSPIPSLDA